MLITAAVVLVLALGATIGALFRTNHHAARTPTAAPTAAPSVPAAAPSVPPKSAAADPTVAQAEQWVTANVDRTAVLAADPAVAADLTAVGFRSTHPLAGAGVPDWHGDAFLVDTPAAEAVTSGTVAAERASSVPVALFGTGSSAVAVRKVLPGGTAGLDQRRAQDQQARIQAGTELLSNPHVHATGAAAQAVRSGGLDLRAGTMLALLADRTDVQLNDVSADAHESAAGLPARTMTISAADPSAISTVLTEMPSASRPLEVTPVAGGSERMRWDIAIAPVPSV